MRSGTGINDVKLSKFTDNTLKVLMYIASRPGQRCTRNEIADYFDLSVEHLRKVIHQLNLGGYLTTFPGRNGGIELARPAAEMNLGEIIRKTEKQMTMFDCQGQDCRLLPSCGINLILDRAQEAFFRELGQYSVGEIIAHKGLLVLLTQEK